MLAHIVPLILFMLLTEVARMVKIENTAMPWYRSAPEHWVYPLQCLIVGAVLWFFRSHYTLKPWRGLPLAIALAGLGIAAWIIPAWLYEQWQPTHLDKPAWWAWLGIVERREGFDPTLFGAGSAAYWATTLLRFLRMTLIVPLVEEIFWRGFLMRYVQAGERPFLRVPFGQHSWPAFGIVTAAFTLIHNPPDYLGALLFGTLMYWLTVRTKSLGACVVMHGAANLLLGLHVMRTSQWGFW
jgi:CAAX prenyl protease-like protein